MFDIFKSRAIETSCSQLGQLMYYKAVKQLLKIGAVFFLIQSRLSIITKQIRYYKVWQILHDGQLLQSRAVQSIWQEKKIPSEILKSQTFNAIIKKDITSSPQTNLCQCKL